MIKPNLHVWLVPTILVSEPRVLPDAFRQEAKDRFNELLWGTYSECNQDLVTGIHTALQKTTRPQITVVLLHENIIKNDVLPILEQIINLFEGRPLHGLLLMGVFPFGITRPLPGLGDTDIVFQIRNQNARIRKFIAQRKRTDPFVRNVHFKPAEPALLYSSKNLFQGPYLEGIIRNNVALVMDGVSELVDYVGARFGYPAQITTGEIPVKRSKQDPQPMEEA